MFPFLLFSDLLPLCIIVTSSHSLSLLVSFCCRRTGSGNMVSIRRRKHVPPKSGRRPSLVPLPTIPDDSVPENLEDSGEPVNVPCKRSAAETKSVEEERKETVADPPTKKQKVHFEIDPEDPLEVHAYLMQLKEDKKLELGPMERSEEMPVKEWMEKCYPHIFGVFPQNPKLLSEFADKSKQNEFLYCHYWLLLIEVRNIVLIDCSVSPERVELLVNRITNLEKEGFDCRFLRSELVVVGNMMKQQLEITLAVKDIISRRIRALENELHAAESKARIGKCCCRANLMEGTAQRGGQELKQLNELQKRQSNGKEEINKLPFAAVEKEYFEVILEGHKKLLEYKEEEGARLSRVLEKINQLYQVNAAFY
ncbi:hypothetical protein Tsubulata_050800 [Turnera subulata]|uniref:Uncharacterized protein n=1 Tax=Turnera subulata TaxID=218843 RepID=A0A9Q0GFD5_9ROSI|nr:hypothetical protein Tsubulata_050800 [Turnera subulata]